MFTGGETLVETIFEGLQEHSRLNITNDVRRFVEVDSREAVKIGDFERDTEVLKGLRPSFNKAVVPNANVREWRWAT